MFQPVRISLESTQPNATVITKLDGLEVDRRSLAAGSQVFEVLVSPVVTPQHAMIAVEGNGARQTCSIDLKPVRKVLVYILPHSHHDLGYTDLQANVEEKQMKNITLGIELARKTAQYPGGRGSSGTWRCCGVRTYLCSVDPQLRRQSSSMRFVKDGSA